MGTLMMLRFQSYTNPHSKCVQQDVMASEGGIS